MIKDARKYNLPQKQSCTPHREMILHKMTNLRVILLLLEGSILVQLASSHPHPEPSYLELSRDHCETGNCAVEENTIERMTCHFHNCRTGSQPITFNIVRPEASNLPLLNSGSSPLPGFINMSDVTRDVSEGVCTRTLSFVTSSQADGLVLQCSVGISHGDRFHHIFSRTAIITVKAERAEEEVASSASGVVPTTTVIVTSTKVSTATVVVAAVSPSCVATPTIPETATDSRSAAKTLTQCNPLLLLLLLLSIRILL